MEAKEKRRLVEVELLTRAVHYMEVNRSSTIDEVWQAIQSNGFCKVEGFLIPAHAILRLSEKNQ